MINFTPIAFIDTFELAASLPERLGLFGHGTPRILPIRGFKKGTDPVESVFAWYTPYAKWTELKNVLSRLKRIGDQRLGEPGIEFGLVFLEMLDPDTVPLLWRRETDLYFERFLRVHLPIRTNPGARMLAGINVIETTHLLPGQLTVVNSRVPYNAINLGEWSRMHLVCDFRKKEKDDAKA